MLLVFTWFSSVSEITIKYKPKKGTTTTIPTTTTATTTTTPSNIVEKNLETVSEPIPQNLEYPPKKSMLYNPFHLPSLCLPPFLRLRTTTTTTSKPLVLPKNEESQDTHFPQRDIIVIAQSVSLALHENLHKCTRIVFYCMVVIGIMTLLISLMIFLYICRRRALLAADAIEAQKRLKHSISVVWVISTSTFFFPAPTPAVTTSTLYRCNRLHNTPHPYSYSFCQPVHKHLQTNMIHFLLLPFPLSAISQIDYAFSPHHIVKRTYLAEVSTHKEITDVYA